ncbi:hypothetical protein ACFY04_28810 [Streptomyces sp. NPDC001549]|uniref:hypothetical protein n=1 Tax=Streptomyces sp. NPDC001549 TaxID=3364586 RepID=UPI0036BBE15A
MREGPQVPAVASSRCPVGSGGGGRRGYRSAQPSTQTAGALRDDGMSAEAVATALGTTRSEALVLLLTAQDS